MLMTLGIAAAGAVVVLVLSYVVSIVGFRTLGPVRGPQWTATIGNLTGIVLGFGALVTVITLVVQAMAG